jgi:hypothetical protein
MVVACCCCTLVSDALSFLSENKKEFIVQTCIRCLFVPTGSMVEARRQVLQFVVENAHMPWGREISIDGTL